MKKVKKIVFDDNTAKTIKTKEDITQFLEEQGVYAYPSYFSYVKKVFGFEKDKTGRKVTKV